MLQFIAFLWDPRDQHSRPLIQRFEALLLQSTVGWRRVVSYEGMVLCVFANRAHDCQVSVLPLEAGVILGRVFRRMKVGQADEHDTLCIRFDDKEVLPLVNSGGKVLSEEYWGSYVALLRDRESNRMFVLRDCSGMLPCYRTRHADIEILFSAIDDLSALELPPFTLNKGFLASFLYRDPLCTRECGLTEVAELLAGDCVEVYRGTVRQYCLWDPVRISSERVIDDYEQARSMLRRTTKRCIRMWASTSDNILLALSGGFDSAVVLGCLCSTSPKPTVTCINHYTSGMPDDERAFAEAAASQAGVEVVELPRNTEDNIFSAKVFALPKFPKPTLTAYFRSFLINSINPVAQRTNASVLWTGQGGDHLFLQSSSSLGAADYIWHHGLGRSLFSAIHDAAHLSRDSYWSVLANAVKLGYFRRPWQSGIVSDSGAFFVNRAAVSGNLDEYSRGPWNFRDLPKGKQLQIETLMDLLNRHVHLPGLELAYEHHPLVSQPLIELSLQIPTYLLVRGGRQRAMARDAFRDSIPLEILRREDKGETTNHLREALRRSEGFLCDILLNGILAHEQVLDRRAVEVYLVKRQSLRPSHVYPLLACVAVELWARSWTYPKADRIAA